MQHPVLGIAVSIAALVAWSGPAAAQDLVNYTVQMNGAAATPPNREPSTGTATFILSGTQLRYAITVQGLSGPATAAHIHLGRVGVAGAPVLTLPVTSVAAGSVSEGTIDLTQDVSQGVSGDSLVVLFNNGSAYINVHTAAHPSGEIRGQVVRQ